MVTKNKKQRIKKPANTFSSLYARRGTEGEAKLTIMKKFLPYLILIGFSGSFISAAPCLCFKRNKPSHTIKTNVSAKDKSGQQDEKDIEIYPLNIFTLRYF